MKKIITLSFVTIATTLLVVAQPTPQPPNAGFETWNGSGMNIEPTNYHSNRTGTGWASASNQTCFQDNTAHSGTYCARIETISYFGNAVNGSLTSGLVNAPTTNKIDGYIGTIQGASGTTINRIAFNGRPDSLVGWYKYTQSTSTSGTGGANEIGKVYAILHKGHYYDPSNATAYHPDSSSNKIGEALFNTPATNVGSWTRFSVPFTYVSGNTPVYILLNCTSSNNQLTNVTGSKLWLDDIGVVYNPSSVGVSNIGNIEQDVKVYSFENTFYIDFMNRNNEKSFLGLFDVTGKLILRKEIENNKLNSFDIGNINSGLYLYQLSGKDFSKSGKITLH